MKISQGDSYPIFFKLTQAGYVLTPDMLDDMRVCVGEVLEFQLSKNEVFFDNDLQLWYFRPSQADTMLLDPESYQVDARVKYTNDPADVIKIPCGRITVEESSDKKEI